MNLLIKVTIDPKKVNGNNSRLFNQALKDIQLDILQGKIGTTAGGVGYTYTFRITQEKG